MFVTFLLLNTQKCFVILMMLANTLREPVGVLQVINQYNSN